LKLNIFGNKRNKEKKEKTLLEELALPNRDRIRHEKLCGCEARDITVEKSVGRIIKR